MCIFLQAICRFLGGLVSQREDARWVISHYSTLNPSLTFDWVIFIFIICSPAPPLLLTPIVPFRSFIARPRRSAPFKYQLSTERSLTLMLQFALGKSSSKYQIYKYVRLKDINHWVKQFQFHKSGQIAWWGKMSYKNIERLHHSDLAFDWDKSSSLFLLHFTHCELSRISTGICNWFKSSPGCPLP
jgi:hypothetical protein